MQFLDPTNDFAFKKIFGDVPAVIHEEAIKEAFEIVNRLNLDEAELELYDIR